MSNFTPESSVLGGSLIGLAAVLLYRLNGRIAGISGIVHGLFDREAGGAVWRGLFVVGLIGGGWLYQLIAGTPVSGESGSPLSLVILAGLLVGVGTRLGSGCTSGHGVCGIARFSMRSLVATVTFLFFGIATATLVYGVFMS